MKSLTAFLALVVLCFDWPILAAPTPAEDLHHWPSFRSSWNPIKRSATETHWQSITVRTNPSTLFVLSRSGEFIKEYDTTTTPESLVRTLTLPTGSVPTGLDVDSAGNIYVALSGHHQIAKYKLESGSYTLDTTFNGTGKIGKSNQTSGTGNGEFNTPYDVAVAPGGEEFAGSDSGNHRIQRFNTSDGDFIGAFGTSGSGAGQFKPPKGLVYDGSGYLYIVDSGNNRVALALSSSVVGTSGSSGSVLGQFSGPVNLCVGPRGIYVADAGNNRVQAFNPFENGNDTTALLDVRLSLSTQFSSSLNQPNAIAPIGDFLAEKIYIADTGNGRVLKVALPEGALPSATWTGMKTSLLGGNISQASSHFSQRSADVYRRSFTAMGSALIKSTMDKTVTSVVINGDTAQYNFQDTIHGDTITFPVEFVRENGVWKILEF